MIQRNILFICGSFNQTTMMHKISRHLTDYHCYFTPYFAEGLLNTLSKSGFLDHSILGLGSKFRKETLDYLNSQGCSLDEGGVSRTYDLILTCSDLVIPPSIRNKKIILVQEGMTDPESWTYQWVKKFNLPGWMAFNTSTTGLSDAYQKFCVASEGYRDFFEKKGIRPEKMVVTGIPNFDDAQSYLVNTFPHRDYVLVATSDMRETMKFENRQTTIEEALKIAAGRKLVFKLHPNEDHVRAVREVKQYAPSALVFTEGNAHHMIANCDVFITKYSTLVYTAISLGKEIYADADLNLLRKLSPIQNQGESAKYISDVCRDLV